MSTELRQFAAGFLALVSLAVWLMLASAFESTLALSLPMLGSAVAAGGWVFLRAALGDRVALLGILTFCLIGLSISFRVRDQGAAGLDWQNGIKAVVWLGLMVVIILNWRAIVRMCADPAVLAWFCYALLCILSAAYSPVPLLSAMSALSAAAYLGFACLLAFALPARSVWLTMVWGLAALITANLVAGLVSPDTALLDHSRLQGISGHPNSLGQQTIVFLILTFGAYYRKDLSAKWSILLIGLGSMTLLWTQSRTALISCVIAAFCQLRRPWLLLAALAAVLIGAAIYLTDNVNTLLDMIGREGDGEDALTMAGRTDLWQFVVHEIVQQPVIGHGFNSFEAVATPLWYGQRTAAMEAHNGYLEALFDLGILGFIPYVIGFLILLYRWIREPYPPRDQIVLTLVVANFTEAIIPTIAVLPTLALFTIITLDATRRLATGPEAAMYA